MKNANVTRKMFIELALANATLIGMDSDYIEVGNSMLESLAKKSATKGKSKDAITKDNEIKDIILDILSNGKSMRVGDIVKDSRLIDLDVSASLCTARLRDLVASGKVVNAKDKKVSTYALA